jgi:hypothetical protein
MNPMIDPIIIMLIYTLLLEGLNFTIFFFGNAEQALQLVNMQLAGTYKEVKKRRICQWLETINGCQPGCTRAG